MNKWLVVVGVLLVLLAATQRQEESVSGVVLNEAGEPLGGAIVRVQTTQIMTHTAPDGSFTLPAAGNLTAWASGYFNGGPVEALPGQTGVEIRLAAHTAVDHPDYEWVSAFSAQGKDGNCQNCHAADGLLPFDEWQQDAHAKSASNPRFLSLYNGTDLQGNQSPPTRFVYQRDYGTIPLPPDLSQPYYGAGYLLDFPDTAGNCATCHTPMLANPAEMRPTEAQEVAQEGISCDFCHKIWAVALDSTTQLPFNNETGMLALELRRPATGHQFFAGPYDDVAPGEDTFSPLQRESAICAACHYGVFWGTQIYNSYGEWLASPYSNPETGKTCQSCHMPPRGATHFALPQRGGLERDPQTIFSHNMTVEAALLQNSAELSVTATRQGERLEVEVTVENTQTGHHLPTDSPLRQMFVVVRAYDAANEPLSILQGAILPAWAGDLAGQPGRYYAKLLEQLWTETMPTGAYWMPTRISEDTRLAAFASDTSTYTFEAVGEVRLEVQLIFRRAPAELMRQKAWAVPDIVMEEVLLVR